MKEKLEEKDMKTEIRNSQPDLNSRIRERQAP